MGPGEPVGGPSDAAEDGHRTQRDRRATIAIVGRPNVGKSTLFNRLVGRRRAIVHDLPGVTRDRIVETVRLDDAVIIDFIDTGGLVAERDDPLGLGGQVLSAVEESDALLLVVDGRTGPVPGDEEVLSTLRPRGKPIVLVVNKADAREARAGVGEFHRLGLDPVLVSAEHGTGIERLREVILELVPDEPVEEAAPAGPTVAIVGRPNVGKSSLLNRVVGADRVLVSEQPGTTRDPIDTVVEWQDRTFVLVDTAGIRRRSKVSGAPEDLAVMMAQRQIERAQAALLLIDAAQGVTSGDLAIAGAIREQARACVVVMNKWDLLSGDSEARERLEVGWERLAELLSGPARVNISAATGRGVDKIFPQLARALDDFHRRVETSRLNAVIERAMEHHHAPAVEGKPWKVYYGSQVGTAPPTFMLFATRSLPQKSSLRRYLENFLRRELDLGGVPIRLVIRQRRR
jgi:GTP-binding protein